MVLALCGALLLSLLMTGSAAAATQTLKVKLTSTKSGTSKKPKGIGLTLSTGTVSALGEAPLPIQTAKIIMPTGVNLNYKSFPSCSVVMATNRNCSSKTAVGTGSATAHLNDVDYDPQGQLTQYQGTNGQLFIHTVFYKPAIIDENVVGKIKKSGSHYELGFTVPPALQEPLPGTRAQVLDFTTKFPKQTVKKKGKTINYIETTSCPKKGWVFKGEFVYVDGTTATASYTVKCKR